MASTQKRVLLAPTQHGNPAKYAQWSSYEYDAREFATDAAPLVNTDGSVANLAPVWANFVAAMGTSFTRPRKLLLPNGTYDALMSAGTAQLPSTVAGRTAYSIPKPSKPLGLVGESRAGTIIRSDAYSAPFGGGSGTGQVADVEIGNLTIDCSAQSITASAARPTDPGDGLYHAYYKGIFWSDMLRLYAHDITVINSGATSLGLDYLVDYLIENCTIYQPGRFVRELGLDPTSTSGGSGIGIGTGKYASEPGRVSNVIVYNAGRVGFFWEGQPYIAGYGATSRGPVVASNLVAIGCWAGLQDCGLDGLDIELSAYNCTYGAYLEKTTLTPGAGMNGTVRLQARDCTVADVYANTLSATPGRYTVNLTSPSGKVGVIAPSGHQLRSGLHVHADVSGHSGPGAWIADSTTQARDLWLSGAFINNGQDATGASGPREGVRIEAASRGLRVNADVSDTQDTVTQQVGVSLRGSTARASLASVKGVAQGVPTPAVIEQSLSADFVFAVDGASLGELTALRVVETIGAGAVSLTATLPVSMTGVTDIPWRYRTADVGSGAGAWTVFAAAASLSASRTVTGLTNNTAYEFQPGKTMAGTTTWATSSVTATPIPANATAVYRYTGTGNTVANLDGVATNGGTASKKLAVLDAASGAVWAATNGIKVSAGTGNTFLTLDVGSALGYVEDNAVFLQSSSSPLTGLVCNLIDPTTYLYVQGRATYQLLKRVGGVSTTLGTTTRVPAVGDTRRLIRTSTGLAFLINGTVVPLTVAGQPVNAYPLTSDELALFNRGTRFGLLSNFAVDPNSKVGAVTYGTALS